MDIKWCYGDIDLGVELWTASMRLNTKLTLTLRPAATISCSETPDGPIMRYNWPQFGLSIVLHDRGDVILMDDRVPDENLLEYSADKFQAAVDYQLEKLDTRICHSTT